MARLIVLQHVSFEGPGAIADWADARGHDLSTVALFDGARLPSLDSFEGLCVLGGPMNVDEVERHAWLLPERRFIGEAIEAGKPVLGVCLGAQLIARALGADVVHNLRPEIGWFPVSFEPAAREALPTLPAELVVLHWHADRFDLPAGVVRLGASAACPEQGFYVRSGHRRALGLQFHIEATESSLLPLVEHCRSELIPGAHVQQEAQILQGLGTHGAECVRLLHGLLDELFSGV